VPYDVGIILTNILLKYSPRQFIFPPEATPTVLQLFPDGIVTVPETLPPKSPYHVIWTSTFVSTVVSAAAAKS